MSSLHQRLHRAHQERRAQWAARGVIEDPGIDLKRIRKTTRVLIMPWASDTDVQEIEAHMEQQPITISREPEIAADAAPAEGEAQAAALSPKLRPMKLDIPPIAKFVARHYGVDYADMLGPRRTANLVRPRQIAMYLAKTICKKSLPYTGRRFGGRDHTTVLHAIRKVERMMADDVAFAAEVNALKTAILTAAECGDVE